MAALLLTGCGGAAADGDEGSRDADPTASGPQPLTIQGLPSPAGPESGEPNLAVGPDGVYLSWLERTGSDTHALRLSRWDGSQWSEPAEVMNRSDLFVNWADFPAVVAFDDGTLAAHWLEKSGPGTYSYDVRMALSRDGGLSWGPDIIPHRDGVEAEHGFVSLFPVDGRAGVVWLDGRETVNGSPMTLRFTTLAADGGLGPETLLDDSTCDCCQTSVAMTGAGPIVAYRDRSEGEVRDIYVTRRVDGEWTGGHPVHRDGWVIAACPVNGPSIAADGATVAVAWFTGAPVERADDAGTGAGPDGAASGAGRVLVAFSRDGGATFGEPVRVDEGGGMGRVDLLLLEDGSALVVWLERAEGSGRLMVRRVEDGTGPGPAMALVDTGAERSSGFPRMARTADGAVLFAWTDPGDPATVRTALGRLEGDSGRPTVAGEAP
jgi:hypothetical protein